LSQSGSVFRPTIGTPSCYSNWYIGGARRGSCVNLLAE
jgi:hypothetical protein